MAEALRELSRFERVVENLRQTMAGIPGIAGVTTEEPDGEDGYKRVELPHVWLYEQGETPTPENNQIRCRVVFVVVAVFKRGGTDGPRAVGRRLLAALQFALAQDPQRGFDKDQQSHAQDTIEQTSFNGDLGEGYGAIRLEIQVTYLRGVLSPYKRQDK